MGWLPTTHRNEWSDRDACKHAISGGRGVPSARILLPYDEARPGRRQSLNLTLRNSHDRLAREIEGGWKFDLGIHRQLEYTHVDPSVDPYGNEGGGLKTTVTMDVAPEEWQLQFDLTLPQGVSAYEQLPLSQSDLDDGAYMPPHVEYSYALYSNGSKVGHVYRLFVVDGNGDRCWCSMALVGGVLTVFLPRDWMQSGDRAWPIVLDPFIGYNTVGGTAHTLSANVIYGLGKTVMPEDGTASSMQVNIRTSTTNGRTMGIYSDSAGPSTLLKDTVEDTQTGTGWLGVDLDSTLALNNTTTYWVAILQGANVNSWRDAAPVGSTRLNGPETYTPGDLSAQNPFPSASNSSLEWSVRAFYTAAGGADPAAQLVDGGLVNRGLVNGGLVA